MNRRRAGIHSGLLAAALIGSAAAAAQPTLHLMFPYDYLALPEDERRMYVLGVVDARLTTLYGKPALPPLIDCLVERGLERVRMVLEREVIPTSGAGATPMPYVVDRAVAVVCDPP